jgi:hypothetical protein
MTNIIDKFLKEYSYKFPKGYPDLSNSIDIEILNTILESINIGDNSTDNNGYHVGPINTPSESLKSRGWYFKSRIGYLGTGIYYFGELEDAISHSKSIKDNQPVFEINLDNYNLFVPTNPNLFYDYMKEITYGLGNLTIEDLNNPEIKDSIDEIVKVIIDDLNILIEEDKLKEILVSFVKDVNNRVDGPLLSNRLLQPLGYEGIDNRKGNLDNYGVGSVLFDVKDNTYKEIKNSLNEYSPTQYDKILNKIGINDILQFKNDPKTYYVKNLANDRISVYVTDKWGQIFNKKLKNIVAKNGKPININL